MAVLAAPGRRWPTIATGVATVVVLVAGVVAAAVVDRSGPPHPDAWDPRVGDLAAFVERERNLTFDHPVFVDFLPEEEFREQVTAEEGDLTVEDRADLGQGARLLRAIGLVQGSFDLLESANQLSGEGTLAYYDPERQRITVRGTELTVGLRVTLVHELTHALQDQRFDLSRLGMLATEGQNGALLALVEGDAVRTETAWIDQLGDDDLAALDDEAAEQFDRTDLTGVPGPLVALFSAPYVLGRPLVDALLADGGQRRIDEAMAEPPRSEEQLLDPFTYLDGDDPVPVMAPPLGPGERELEVGEFGALIWFIVLSEHLDARQALDAVDGWGGGSYTAFEREGRTCLRSAFRGDTAADTEEMAVALDAWARAVPATTASVSRSGALVELAACDPGPDATGPEGGGAQDALIYPVVRTLFTLDAMESGAPRGVARCVASEFVRGFTTAELLALDTSTADPRLLDERTRTASDACRAGA